MLKVVLVLGFMCVTALGQTCDPAKCLLPNCRCANDKSAPGGLKRSDLPQIVMVTFQNNINSADVEEYRSLFNIVNPNGCAVRGTFFVSDEGTDYDYVRTLYDEGHEIGVNSLDGTRPSNDVGWIDMYRTIKNKMSKKGVPDKEVVGSRAPELAPGGTNQYIGLGNNDMLYDSSCARTAWSDPGTLVWPFTLDYTSPVCDSGEVPDFPFPGYWEVPVADLHDLTSEKLPCATPSACRNVTTKADAFDIFYNAFEDHVGGSRTPMLMIIDPAWAKTPDLLAGTVEFLEYIRAAFPDEVWIVPVRKALSWIQDPVPLSNITSFQPWSCN